ncbi:maleylacetate reductase [Rhodoligotrophos defluvii]|uniref:maleylacetate reductase n=1 Tax=Rhodoligotrophos defluvii TaxID=2561934 RepID=UPI0010C9A33C|nr:maleylacetate reductase [Rhodoligotrophos defluvii]
MRNTFVYKGYPARVIFGTGTINQLAEEVELLGIRRALVVSTPDQEADAIGIARRLGLSDECVFPGAAMHTPVDITEKALTKIGMVNADGIVAVGGGSTIGLSKAIALRSDLPQLVVPTTYAGSEMTSILGETAGGAKTTLRSDKVLPETVIYDVDLTMSLPVRLSVTSGMNAIAHATEALYAREKNPVISLMAEEGIRVLARALPAVTQRPDSAEARRDALYGAWLCAMCLQGVGMALHHKLCHTIGGMYELPHAETHTIVLPHAIAYNLRVAGEELAGAARAIGADDAAQGMYDLIRALGVREGLRDFGMPRDGVDAVADAAMASPYWNPRPMEPGAIRGLLARAWAGEPPMVE